MAALALASALVACSVVTSLDGLSGGVGGSLGGVGLTPGDASAPVSSGGAGDAAPRDGGGAPVADDAGSTGPSPDAGVQTDSAPEPAPAPTDAGADGACVPTALACDGKAHACNGVVDEGCPTAVSVGGAGTIHPLGSGPDAGGPPFDDPCPSGQVLIGMGGATGGWIDAINGICGVVSLHASLSQVPYSYSVTVSAGATLPTRGTVGSTDVTWTSVCPANEVVVGVAGNSGLGMDHVTLSCAPLTVTGSPGAFTVGQGGVTVLAPAGDVGGGSPFTPVSCPAGQAMALVTGGAGNWVNWLGVACATVGLDVVP